MSGLMEYKCKLCGGGLEFDTKLQKLKCPYCDSIFDIEEVKNKNNSSEGEIHPVEGTFKGNWDVKGKEYEWDKEEISGMTGYSCKSCGAEILGDENLAATSCPYCGNPIVMLDRLTGVKRPNFVVPFKFDKKSAKEALTNHYKKKKLLPIEFKDDNHLDEIKGIYVPFWLFHCDVEGNVVYHAENIRHWEDSEYSYTQISNYTVVRDGNLHFDNIPMDGMASIPDDLMESIEPFDWNDKKEFQTAYLAGFFANKYDVKAEEVLDRVTQRVKSSTEDALRRTVTGYDSVSTLKNDVIMKDNTVDYAMLPVWFLSTNWNGQNFIFAMNGQTGKFIGDLPVDKKLAIKYFLRYTGGFTVITFIIAWIILNFFM